MLWLCSANCVCCVLSVLHCCCAGDHARVSDIVSEVEQRDLREATERLQQAAGGSRMLSSDTDSDGDDCSSCYVDEHHDAYYDDSSEHQRSRRSAYEDS